MDNHSNPSDDHNDRIAPRMRPRTWQIIVGASVAALVVGGVAAASAGAFSMDAEVPGDVQSLIDGVFTDGECTDGATASQEISDGLTDLAEDGWQVVTRPGADESACVAAGLLPDESTVVLVPVAGPEVASTLSAVGEELMARCLSADDAEALVASTLRSSGVDSFQVSRDGPLAYPTDQKDAVLEHVENGCVVYSGNGSDADGNLTVYISGGDS